MMQIVSKLGLPINITMGNLTVNDNLNFKFLLVKYLY